MHPVYAQPVSSPDRQSGGDILNPGVFVRVHVHAFDFRSIIHAESLVR